jgi:hypothetical protein
MYISTSLSVMTEMKDVLTMSFKPEMGEHGPDITLPPLISRLVCGSTSTGSRVLLLRSYILISLAIQALVSPFLTSFMSVVCDLCYLFTRDSLAVQDIAAARPTSIGRTRSKK